MTREEAAAREEAAVKNQVNLYSKYYFDKARGTARFPTLTELLSSWQKGETGNETLRNRAGAHLAVSVGG